MKVNLWKNVKESKVTVVRETPLSNSRAVKSSIVVASNSTQMQTSVGDVDEQSLDGMIYKISENETLSKATNLLLKKGMVYESFQSLHDDLEYFLDIGVL